MKKLIFTLLALAASVGAMAQERAFEIGIGGSIYQFNRIPYMNIVTDEDGHTVNMKMRNSIGTANIGAAYELSNVFVLDSRIGMGKIEHGIIAHGQLGLQMRMGHWFNSPYIDPYVRVGAGYMNKNYIINYSGDMYSFTNNNNKDGNDKRSTTPLTAGIGINMWLNDFIGLNISTDYMYVPQINVANSLIGSVGIIFRFGGKSKKPQPVINYIEHTIETQVERIVEKEVIREVEKLVLVSSPFELLSQITFDFDSYTLDPKYDDIIEAAANIMKDGNWLITGFTDAKGTTAYNERLSLIRAEAVRDALHNCGVTAVKAIGAGKRIANAPIKVSDKVREHDRKIYVEQIFDINYWDLIP